MKLIKLLKLMCIAVPLVMLSLVSSGVSAAGLMKPTNSSLPDLEIRGHQVDVVIEDGYVITSIEQIFYNPSASELEAIYSFPVPESASVGEFVYWINDQPVIAEVVEKVKARKIYEEEKFYPPNKN